MRTWSAQRRDRLAYLLRHPVRFWPYARKVLWDGLVLSRRRDAMHADPEGRAMLPSRVFYVMNSGCNLRCVMCDVGNLEPEGLFSRNTNRKRPDWLTLDEIEAFAGSLGWRPEVTVNGTEPCLHPRLPEIVHAFTRRGMWMEVITNATELPRHAGGLLDAGLGGVTISFDGPDAEVHDRIRGVAGAFDRSLAGMRHLLDLRRRRRGMLPLVNVTCVMQPGNVEHLVRTAEFADREGVDSLTFAHVMFTTPAIAEGHNRAFPAYPTATFGVGAMDPAQVDPDRLYDALLEVQRRFRGKPVIVRPGEMRSREAIRAYYRDHSVSLSRLGYPRCHPLQHSPQVYPNGDVNVSSACFTPMFGNIRETPLREIWNGEAYRRFRRDILAAGGLMPGCARCTFAACTTRVGLREKAFEDPA